MNCRMQSSRVPSTIKYGRPPSAALTRSFLIEGHFLRVAGAIKIDVNVSLIHLNAWPSLSFQLPFYRFRTTAFLPVGDLISVADFVGDFGVILVAVFFAADFFSFGAFIPEFGTGYS